MIACHFADGPDAGHTVRLHAWTAPPPAQVWFCARFDEPRPMTDDESRALDAMLGAAPGDRDSMIYMQQRACLTQESLNRHLAEGWWVVGIYRPVDDAAPTGVTTYRFEMVPQPGNAALS